MKTSNKLLAGLFILILILITIGLIYLKIETNSAGSFILPVNNTEEISGAIIIS
jgi:hypothetical protein